LLSCGRSSAQIKVLNNEPSMYFPESEQQRLVQPQETKSTKIGLEPLFLASSFSSFLFGFYFVHRDTSAFHRRALV
jgi:hypothetical protein